MSFCGPDQGKYEYFHFNPEILREAASGFCQSILDMIEPEQTKVKQAMDEIESSNIDRMNGVEKKEEPNKQANAE
jgi:hypothetical protein